MEHRKAHILEDKERTEDIKVEENVTFAQLYLSDPVLSGLETAGFIWPSPIQLNAIPLGRCGLDLVIQAKSGTGKTCVFAVVALEMITLASKTTQVLIVAPTREIAVQITQVIDTLGSHMPGLRAFPFIGGFSVANDKSKLSCCHIAIGTPGRLIQLIELGFLKVENVRLFVLDEADQLLSSQFKSSILKISSKLPLNKQVLALSATYPDEVSSVVDKIMRSPSHVRLDRETPSLIGVGQFIKLIPNHPQPHHRYKLKQDELINILSSISFNQCLIFSNSQMRAESLCGYLKECKWPVSYLSGNQAQSDRLRAFKELCSYKIRVLVSTDVSARGLDSEHVNLVVNLDIPQDHATYLHRVGRAGRFGSFGTAISLACEGNELESMKAISTLSNVEIKIITEKWTTNLNLSPTNNFKSLEHLSEEDLNFWLKYLAHSTKEKSESKITKLPQNGLKKSKQKLVDGSVSLESYYKEKLELESSKNLGNDILKSKNEASSLDLLAHSQIYPAISFSYSELLSKCEKRDILCKADKTNSLSIDNLTRKVPSSTDLKNLDNFINDLLNESENSLKIKAGPIDRISLLEGVIQGIEFKDQNEEDKDDQSCVDSLDEEPSEDLLSTPLKNLNLNQLEDSLPIVDNLCRSSNVRTVNSKSKKSGNFNVNTGFGTWGPVTKQDTNHETNIKVEPISYSPKHNTLSNSASMDSFYTDYNNHDTHYQTYYNSMYAFAHSAQKFASMMEYAKTLGRMSVKAAYDYQSRKTLRRNH